MGVQVGVETDSRIVSFITPPPPKYFFFSKMREKVTDRYACVAPSLNSSGESKALALLL